MVLTICMVLMGSMLKVHCICIHSLNLIITGAMRLALLKVPSSSPGWKGRPLESVHVLLVSAWVYSRSPHVPKICFHALTHPNSSPRTCSSSPITTPSSIKPRKRTQTNVSIIPNLPPSLPVVPSNPLCSNGL